MSAGPGPRGGRRRRRRAGTGQEVGPRAAAEQSATFQVSRQTSRRGGAERSSGSRRGPEVPPCPARALRLFRPLSSLTGSGARGLRGSRALPGAPGCPSLHRGSRRAHWPRRGDHPGRSPLRPPPPRASPGRGGGRRPRPARASPQTESGSEPPLPGQPPGGRAVGGFTEPPVQGGAEWLGRGPGLERKGVAAPLPSPGGGALSLATANLRPAGQRRAGLRRIREALSPQGISHNHHSKARD